MSLVVIARQLEKRQREKELAAKVRGRAGSQEDFFEHAQDDNADDNASVNNSISPSSSPSHLPNDLLVGTIKAASFILGSVVANPSPLQASSKDTSAAFFDKSQATSTQTPKDTGYGYNGLATDNVLTGMCDENNFHP